MQQFSVLRRTDLSENKTGAKTGCFCPSPKSYPHAFGPFTSKAHQCPILVKKLFRPDLDKNVDNSGVIHISPPIGRGKEAVCTTDVGGCG